MKVLTRSLVATAIAGSLLLAACGGGGGGGGGGNNVPPVPTPTPTLPPTATMHDNDGHGTDVAGIAAENANNTVGFAGVAYNVPLQFYKVFPDPPVGCNSNVNAKACETSASGADEIKAIGEAVTHGAKVINLSLGSSGQSTAERNAVENAIASGVVVVAASGNGDSAGVGQSTLDCPACYAGVIAVGATTLDDANPSAIVEKVASYSNYDSANPTTWGIVAPGGDPDTSVPDDPDLLHWIFNIFTTTPTDVAFKQACTGDFGSSATPDCRVKIAGTSQATPHVAGAAALLLSVGLPAAQVKTFLCNNATAIGGTKSGCGRLNIYKAMAAVVHDPSPPAPSGPTYVCSSAGAPQSASRELASMANAHGVERIPRSAVRHDLPAAASPRLLVTYDRNVALSHSISTQSLRTQGLEVQSEIDMARVGKVVRVVNVAAGRNVDDAMRQLRGQAGVLAVERDVQRYAQSTTPLFPNDDYFNGASGARTPPFYQQSTTGGQWDDHVICAANAWGYATANSTGSTFAAAAGGTVPIAIIDTGGDLTHPELAGRATVGEIIDSGNGTVTP